MDHVDKRRVHPGTLQCRTDLGLVAHEREAKTAGPLAERERGPSHVLSAFVVDAVDADAHGYEPISAVGAAEPVAYVSSGGYGHTIGTSIGLAYLPTAHAAVGTELEVTVLGQRRAATVVEQPLYDPQNARLRS